MYCPPLVKAILGKKIIYFSIGSFYGAISIFLSILYVDCLACGLGSFYSGGDKMQISRDTINTAYGICSCYVAHVHAYLG